MVVLPEARSIRWQPIRGGLVNIYRYDYEEFRYEQGRLLLRGNNGTGKSRVLALQLPFLLDGEISPHRLEPDGDPAKRMEWNLLLNKHPDRLGYTWIEFGRIDANGIAHFLTLGCGLHAVEGKGIHGRWFFVTSQRVGQDLFLATTTGQPLGKNRLEAELGEHGQIYTSAEAYREVVDRALFKLGDRYETLIELLIRLRQPKLSRTWDEKQLSDALSDALPPISSGVLADVAEAFGTLETDRRKLADYQTARDGVEAFLSEYRLYIQIAARRRAEGVRKTHSEYEGTQRRLRKAESEHDEASTELRTIEERIAKLRADAEGANEAVQTLASSPQMRDAEALDEARRLADDRRAEASRAEADWEVAKVRRLQSDAESAAASEAETTAWSNAEAVLQQSQAGAAAIGLELNHRDSIEKLDLPASASLKTIDTAEHAVRGFVRKRQDAVHHIRQANRAVEAAQLELHSAKGIYSQCETRLSEATENQRATQLQLQKEAESFLANYGTWLTNLRELQLQQADILAEKIADWCELGHGENPLVSTVREAARQAAEQIAQLQADARQRQTFVAQQLLELRDEYRQLESGFHRPPPAPYTRTADSRAGRPGAPLWALCDFSPDVEPTHRAGIEAALESAGLLDAWVTPDGRLLDTREHDTLLISGHS
ncbi:MAG: TIGR02680 family protein, partial [Planctomycetes bacterium]|nr:TIGR02680 family protein [Planctomycetota bacterium]